MASAEEWYRNLTTEQKTDWDVLSAAFLEKFRSPTFRLECSEKLHAIKQYPQECVNAYSDRVRKLAKLLDPIQGVQKRKTKQVWLRGLRPEFFLVEMNNDARDFEGCVQLALEQEYRLGGAANQGVDLARKVNELEKRLQNVMASTDVYEGDYRQGVCAIQTEPVYGFEDDNLVATVQTNSWAGPPGVPGQVNMYPQQQPVLGGRILFQ